MIASKHILLAVFALLAVATGTGESSSFVGVLSLSTSQTPAIACVCRREAVCVVLALLPGPSKLMLEPPRWSRCTT